MITIFLFCLISLVSCGAPSEVKQEAEERLKKYKPIFEQKVKDVADYITTSVDDDGVLQALKHFNVL